MPVPSDTSGPAPLTRPGSILVIGAGIIGRCCALQLARQGHAITLLDDDTGLQAPSWGNAGHIAIEQTSPLASPTHVRQAWSRWYRRGGPMDIRRPWSIAPWLGRFLRASRADTHARGQAVLRAMLAEAMPAWQRLDALLPGSPQILPHGHLVVWESAASAAAGYGHWQQADTGEARLRALSAQEQMELARHVGAAGSGLQGIGFAGSAQIRDPVQLAAALDAALASHGVRRANTHVQSLVHRGSHTVAMTADGEQPRHDRILVCAGVRAAPLLAGLGETVPLVAERGYHLQWSQHHWPEALPPVVFEDRSVILTRFDSGLRLAGFVEFAPRDTPPDPGKWQRLAMHAKALGLPVRGEPRAWTGARPTLPDYLPALGHASRAPDVLYAIGHQHLGLTLAATTAELVGRQLQGQALPDWLPALALSRFKPA
ncbi:NAD(P)/FAD-dependent oxidoreductase [Frateuria aurantia]|uniref:Glycine/D-amino acid oxidase, deaminating n=1 Tax=Frateuria aurantia (strain ATCC 33424 / DSM 6220 / KCTC 2777 / LMG 1558 / NBRC 3245 / NCIMB 13370) TaxID=767434 RepID=H8L5K7_FRAAD|nr:FAD-binding oxidoreductase [Frateuria aurantia]AFC85808.1 glycine/D-amino acid oxidase, deaminating [Frateuria aurantia DSM 6220]